jgi:hypothetical protein
MAGTDCGRVARDAAGWEAKKVSAGIARRRARIALGLGVLSAGLVGSMAIILRPAEPATT